MMLITRALSAAAMVVAFALSFAGTRVNAQTPYSAPLETVIIGSVENLHPTICGLDEVPHAGMEVACSNGEVIQYFRYAPMTAIWGSPAPAATQGRQKCPKHYRGYKDDNGHTWCMDSQGLSYTPQYARDTEKFKKAHAIHSASFRE